jgi:hypothetical protein
VTTLPPDPPPPPPQQGGGGVTGESWVRDNAQSAEAHFHENGGHNASGSYSLNSYLLNETSHGCLTFHLEGYSYTGLGNLDWKSWETSTNDHSLVLEGEGTLGTFTRADTAYYSA